MTCIIVHKSGWMAADTRGCQGPQVLSAVFKKIIVCGTPKHTLLGICGQASVIHDFSALAPEAGEDMDVTPEIFRQATQELKDDTVGSSLLVNSKGQIFMLDCLGACTLLTPETQFECIGSGQETAYGYLRKCQQLNGVVTPDDAIAAIAAAAERDFTVGGPVIVETLF